MEPCALADVRPFRALAPNPQIVGNPAGVICPPYDVISPQMRRDLYRRHPFNLVRIEEGETFPSDGPANNRHTRAAATLRQWTESGALVRDETPAFYLLRHRFPFGGAVKSRLSLIACVRLEEYENRIVLPHEHTQGAAKEDRLALMETTRSNISQIMLLYRDGERKLSGLFDETTAGTPVFDFSDPEGSAFQLWRIADPEKTGHISDVMASKPLYIADGHHRYETALTYRARRGPSSHSQAHDFVMSSLIEMDDPGLLVLPYHRVLGRLDAERTERLDYTIDSLFTREPAAADPETQLDRLLQEIETRGREQSVIGLAQAHRKGAELLTLRPGLRPKEKGPIASFEAWILEEMALKPVLGDSLNSHVTWLHDAAEAVELLRGGSHQAAFLLKALPMDLFETIVSRAERLPRKSTFFHPKLPTGLTINPLYGPL